MTRSSFPLYSAGIEAYLNRESETLARMLANPDLSIAEKRLLETRLKFRDNRYDEAAEILQTLSTSGIPFLEAERNLLVGNYHAYKGEWQEALIANHQALIGYESIRDRRGTFLTNYNLSVDYGRLGLNQAAEHFLRQAEKGAEAPPERVLVLRAQASLLSSRGGDSRAIENAVRVIEKALALHGELNDVDRTALVLVAADIYFRANNRSKSYELLAGIRHVKATRDRARILFDLALLEMLLKEQAPFTALGVAPAAVQESVEYSLKWSIIRNLQIGELGRAEELWEELTIMASSRYGAKFTALGTPDKESLFMTIIESIRNSNPERIMSGRGGSKLAKLIELLSVSEGPIRKENLIEEIWRVKYDPSFDARFYKLIERARRECGLELVNVNQAYVIRAG
jgi:tetratricopeptide (TPR) repeat protein